MSPMSVMQRRSLLAVLGALVVASAFAVASAIGARTPSPVDLPTTLPDRDFWQLSVRSSEPGGTFHSENYISNENRYQTVLPELTSRVKPGGLYLGVGPEQNFTYIAAVRPSLVFIVDIRRGNLLEHLLYKALMELSTDRADFIARLFSRPRPEGLGSSSTVGQLFAGLDWVESSESLFKANLTAVLDSLTKKRGLGLSAGDVSQLEFIYRTAFFTDGPNLMYRRTDFVNAGRRPTYAELMVLDDGTGRQRSYLASEDDFQFLKGLQLRNLIVPVVGDFSGPKALRAVGAYARNHGATVTAFYLSNVEMYLPGSKWTAFCQSVASMPLDASSTFIRSYSTGGGFFSELGAMQAETQRCASRR